MYCQYPYLFQPLKIRGKQFKNRIIGAPAGSWLMYPHNYGYDYEIDLLEEKARGGCASVTIGDTEVNAGDAEQDTAGVYFNLRSSDGSFFLNQITNTIHQHGALASLQLNHAGEYAGPSVNTGKKGRVTREMTHSEIQEVIDQFAKCAARLKETGFDIVMIHGAHGWLLDQFFNSNTNRRTDEWGGSLEKRLRFPLEVVKAVRRAIGDEMLIEYRISGYDPQYAPEEFSQELALVKALEDYIDIIHVSAGGSGGSSMSGTSFPTYLNPNAPNVRLAAALKPHTKLPVVGVGSIISPELAENILKEGKVDFIALARPLIADPMWPIKARKNQADRIRPCIGCHKCLEGMHKTHILECSVNACAGAEHRLNRAHSTEPQNVVIVGGGPAGMEAALRAKEFGHNVRILEKTHQLGGNLIHTDYEELKHRLKAYKDYLISEVNRRGITVEYGIDVTHDLLLQYNPDAVICAIGSEPLFPSIAGIDKKNVYTASELFSKEKIFNGKKVAIIGGNFIGCECAASLVSKGAIVTIIEMSEFLHKDANRIVGNVLDTMINEATCHTGTRCTEICDDGLRVLGPDGEAFISADIIVLAAGMKSHNCEAELIAKSFPNTWIVGDCKNVASVFEAIHEAFWAASDI